MPGSEPIISKTLWARGGKRVGDVLAALVLLVLLSPLMLLAALLIRLSGKGAILFAQERGGKDSVIFTLLN